MHAIVHDVILYQFHDISSGRSRALLAAQEDENKQKRRKWVRYERKHSLSAGHIDWHEWDGTSIKVCVILDDASRMMLAGGEFFEIW
jgi:hypothetical protein